MMADGTPYEGGRVWRSLPEGEGLRDYVRLIFDDMFEGVQIIDFEERYAYLNAAAAQHGRRSVEELLGRKMADAYPGIEKTEMFSLLRRCLVDRTPQQMINHFTYADGSSAWFDLRMNPVPMGVLILSLDITAHEHTEEQLRKSEEDLAITLDCMADALITTDNDGRVTRMNPAAETLTGWSESEAKGRKLDELVTFLSQTSGEPVEHLSEMVLRSGVKTGLVNHTLLVARDQQRLPIASSGAPVRDSRGVVRGAVLLLRDMKEQYELTRMLQQAQKMEAIGRLAGGIAHDFNNLLTVIGGYCEVALANVHDNEELIADLTEISQATARASALTRKLLSFSRREVLRPEQLAVNDVVTGIEKMLRRIIGEDIDLVTQLAPDLPAVIFDPGHLEQIIVNLAVNARDAMPAGGTLTIRTASVDPEELVRTHPGDEPAQHVALIVQDTGVGMDEQTQARIFEPFFTTKPSNQGTGLGLATVYAIVEQSGGHITFESEAGRGTIFTVYLPTVPTPDKYSAASQTS